MNRLGRYEESESACRKAIELDPRDAFAWFGLGTLYCDHYQKYSDAALFFEKALEIDGSVEAARQDLVFLYRDFMGDIQTAKRAFEPLQTQRQHEFKDSYHLSEALFAAYDSNWGLCNNALTKAIDFIGQKLPPDTAGDWFRAGAVLLHLNYGEELLGFLRERGDDTRLRPWYEAIFALHRGDRRYLQNIPVEVRSTAGYYFDQIEKRLNALPEKTRRRSMSKPAKKRRKV
jgi:tetratricopeptide (TPR) repeat protein